MHVRQTKPMKRPAIKCPKCEGSGSVDMGLELFTTLQHLKVLGKANAIQLATELELPPMAVNNRLEALRSLGFVGREQDPANLKANRYFLTQILWQNSNAAPKK